MAQEKGAVRTTANQKLVINKVIVSGKFFQIDEATFSAGCKELKPYTFLVWQAIHCTYFSGDKELALSTSHLAALMNAKRQRTVIDAVAELVDKGWLKLIAGNHYELINPVCRNSSEQPADSMSKNVRGVCRNSTEGYDEIRQRKNTNNNTNNNNSAGMSKNDRVCDTDDTALTDVRADVAVAAKEKDLKNITFSLLKDKSINFADDEVYHDILSSVVAAFEKLDSGTKNINKTKTMNPKTGKPFFDILTRDDFAKKYYRLAADSDKVMSLPHNTKRRHIGTILLLTEWWQSGKVPACN